MKSEHYLCVCIVWIYYLCQCSLTENPVMSPSPIAYVTRGDSLVLTCIFQKTGTATLIEFIEIKRKDLTIVLLPAECTSFPQPSNVFCISTDSTITLNISITDSTIEHNDIWLCVVQPVNNASTTIYVTVPVKYVNMTAPIADTVDVIEDLPYQFKCEAAGRPGPVFEWYKQTDGEEEVQIQGSNTTQINELEYESFLTFIPNRRDHNFRLFCKAYNVDILQKVDSGKTPLLNVLYKPDGPPMFVNQVNSSTYTVIESMPQTSTCTITGGNPLATLVLDCFDGTAQQSNTSDTVSSTIIWSAQRGANGQCKCRSQHIADNATVGFNVDVLYIPELPIIRYLFDNGTKVIVNDIDVIQGQNVSFECHSDGNPDPTYAWSPEQTGDATVVILNVTKDMTSVNCTANNEMKPTNASQKNGTNSSSVGVTVLYPSTTPSLTYIATETGFNVSYTIINDTVDVISGDTFFIGCFAEGNPTSTYNWTNQLNIFNSDSNLSIVDIRPDNSQQYTCAASNVMKPTYGVSVPSSSSNRVTFNVMYGPSMPILYYKRGNAWTSITNPTMAVIANITFTLKCNGSTSNPDNVIYSWHPQVGNDLTITSIKPDSPRLYTCNVTNEMKRTFGVTEIGHNSTTINIVVLYPPIVNSLTDKQIEEGLSLKVTCNVTKGYPEHTTFRWSHGQAYILSTTTLEIQNVTRNHTGVYTCLVYNTLQPTFGKVENGSNFKNFFLDVFYKTSIEHFYAARDVPIYVSNLTINETDRVVIYCSVDSNPNSNIIINRNGQQISNGTNVTHISHDVETVGCDDTGVYTCTAYNPHISDKRNASKSLHLYVLCFPRALEPIHNTTVVAQNETARFSVTLVAYPVPRTEDYVWRKQLSNSTWVEVHTTDRINISYGHLQTDLTINNVIKEDYGNYSLTVSNNVVRDFNQVFELIPHEPPGPPRDIQVAVENKYVRMYWLLGFNGGYNQMFVIQLKTDTIPWYNISFELKHNNTNQHAYTTLDGLDFDTTYYVRMFAYNILGRSDYVPDPPLSTTIKSDPILPTSSTNTAGIVGGVVGGILVVVIVVLVGIFIRRKAVSKSGERNNRTLDMKSAFLSSCICCKRQPSQRSSHKTTANTEYVNLAYNNHDAHANRMLLTESHPSQDQTINPNIVKREVDKNTTGDNQYGNIFDGNDVGISNIRTLSMSIRQQPEKLQVEFKKFKTGKHFLTSAAEKPSNKTKNRYREMHPYDKNRVTLPLIEGRPDSDYINASFIQGYRQTNKKYIASQAALENTLPDYWRMIWTQNVTQIVMLTNCIENGRLKCYKYWPNEGNKVYGNITVTLVSEDVYSEYTIRVFNCCMVGLTGSKTVTQYHFTAWPDKDVPDTCISLVQLWKMVKRGTTDQKSPLMVHCSAGVGRTGTFLALDYLYDQAQTEGCVNFYECVVKLREQRMTMVQTADQYAFLHHAVLEALDPIVEVCKTEAFRALKQRLLKHTTDPNGTDLKSEYMMIEAECHVEIIPSVGDENTRVPLKRDAFGDSKLHQNKDKSRNRDILPSDLYRPVLEMVVPGCGDYINAVVLSTYRFIDRMIITQVPLSNTIIDFLRLIWDFEVSTIILMENDIPKNDMYWSASGKHSFGIFEAEVVMETDEKYFIKRKVRYTVVGSNGQIEQKDVLILQYKAWSQDKLPDPASMTSLVAELERKHVMKNPDAPFVVQCMDGATKSGLFCVLWSVLERMKFEREVAISESVRFLRIRRKEIITNFDQYKYCYNLVQHYLDEFEVYSNVV